MTYLSVCRSRCSLNVRFAHVSKRGSRRIADGHNEKARRMAGLFHRWVPDNDLLSRAAMRTIIGVPPFHGPVRDGKEWFQRAMVVRRRGVRGAAISSSARGGGWVLGRQGVEACIPGAKLWDQAARAISTG